MANLLQSIDENIWTIGSEQKFLGVDFGSRMTVIRLSSGDLFLHSPIKINQELASELEALGEVKYLIAPNKYHHLHITDYTSRYPKAEVWGAPGLVKKRRDINFTGEFGDSTEPKWPGEIEYVFFEGVPFTNEVVFYHPQSRTVIFTDLIFNVGTDESLGVKLYAWLDGVKDAPDMPRILRFMVRDREAARESVNKILSWDFDRVSCTHRNIIQSGGKEIVSKAFGKI